MYGRQVYLYIPRIFGECKDKPDVYIYTYEILLKLGYEILSIKAGYPTARLPANKVNILCIKRK